MKRTALFGASAALALGAAAHAQSYPDKLLWGDTHLHTNLSTDAYFLGNRSADADTAYRFAKGEPVIHPYHRARMQLKSPHDFLAVSDHAEMIGVPYSLFTLKDKRLTSTRLGRRLSISYAAGDIRNTFGLFILAINSADMDDSARPPRIDLLTALRWRLEDLVKPADLERRAMRWLQSDPSLLSDLQIDDLARTHWSSNMDAAEKHNQPGKFTTLVAWEYSPTPDGANLHRIVVSSVAPSAAKSFLPYSSNDSNDPADLWRWLDETRRKTGGEFISIPHNSNISKGRMFATVDYEGRPIDADYARLRAAWEPIAEVTQIKGTSETHPDLSTNDDFAGFEFFNRLIEARADAQQTPTVTRADYVRGALKTGLELERSIGVNPYKLGMIGSTDSHSGLSTAEEDNFAGKMAIDSIPENKESGLGGLVSGWEMSASGLAAVWARENTREEIIAAMKRREVYGTTGPKMSVRFFGGFGFTAEDAAARDLAAVGYAKGVPMGGDLTAAPSAPSFLVQAVKDPIGANLDRVQIVKGWLGSDGKARERVFDVAWSSGRAIGPEGKLLAVGDTVNLAGASYANSIGAAELATVWTDPEFDPAARAFYYVRVLEIPTPRNSTYDSVALGKAPPKDKSPTIQERAYTSPIWYSPPGN
jgi:hypothetical protein